MRRRLPPPSQWSVTGVLGGPACFFGDVPKRFTLLSDGLDLFPRVLCDLPDFLGQRAEVFGRRAGQFRIGAILFDAAAVLLALFPLAFRHFACKFSFDPTLLGRSIGHWSLPTQLTNRPPTRRHGSGSHDDDRWPGACLSG